MRPVHLQGFGAGIGYAEMARMRGPLARALAKAKENCEPISADLQATVDMIDELGSAWENRKKVSEVSQKVSQVDSSSFDRSASMSVEHAAPLIGISPQATRKRLVAKTLHGQRVGRAWRVCSACVTALQKGSPCPH